MMEAAGIEPGPTAQSSQIVAGNSADSRLSDVGSTGSSVQLRDSSGEPTVTLSHDAIEKGLEEARSEWIRSGDQTALRRALLELLRRLEENK
jgi:hypothetical protein